jgi:DNA-binding XRE family transcriptional regulator
VNTGLTRDELASLIGATRQTLATLIKDFEGRQVIKVYKRSIFVRDLEALKRMIFEN